VKEVTVSSALHEQGGPSPLWNGARRSMVRNPSDTTTWSHCRQVRTRSGAFDGSEVTPLSGGSVPDEHPHPDW